MSRLFISIVLLFLFPAIQAQQEKLLQDIASELGEKEAGESIGEWVERLEFYYHSPLDINSASEDALSESGFFTPFQIYGIQQYREKYGPFFSIYELSAIPGFNLQELKQLELLLCVEKKDGSPRQFLKGYTLLDISQKLPNSTAYGVDSLPPVYEGSPRKYSGRVRIQKGDMAIGLSYEKDAGEQWNNGTLPEHLTAFMECRNKMFIRKILIGNFRIQRGFGLVYGTGFNSRSMGLTLNGHKLSYGKSFSSNMEYSYFRGIYSELNFGKWDLDAFISYKPEDISLYRLKAGEDLFEKIRKTGSHRTPSEIQGTDLIKQTSAGISLNRKFDNLYLGSQITQANIIPTRKGSDSINNWTIYKDSRANASLYFVAFKKSFDIFGELAIDGENKLAMILGTEYQMNPALNLSISYRRYAPKYKAISPKSFGTGSHPENESGISIKTNLAPLPGARVLFLTDFSKQLDYFAAEYLPGFDRYLLLEGKYTWSKGPELQIRLSERLKNSLGEEQDKGGLQVVSADKLKFDFRVSLPLSPQLILYWRGVHSAYTSTELQKSGNLVYFQTNYRNPDLLNLTFRYMQFDVPDWENRMYVYEPGVRFSFSFLAYSGEGRQYLVVFSRKFKKGLTLRLKSSYIEYSRVQETGSGINIRPGNKVWAFEFQLQTDLYSPRRNKLSR